MGPDLTSGEVTLPATVGSFAVGWSWAAVAGSVAFAEDAKFLTDIGIVEYADPAVQAWIDFILLPPSVNEGEKANEDAVFWAAHQRSLYNGFQHAILEYGDESEPEMAFISIVVGNVNFTAKNNWSPSAVGGFGLGLYVDYAYPDSYPVDEWDAATCGCLLPGAIPMAPIWVGADPPQ